MDWTQIIVTLLVVLLGSGGTIVTIIQNNRTHEKKHDENDKNITAVKDAIGRLETGHKAIQERMKLNSVAAQKQIKYTLTRLHRESVQRGHITRYELECAEDLFAQYIELEGNSFVGEIMKDLRKLPIKFED
jgi:hypothetical protein